MQAINHVNSREILEIIGLSMHQKDEFRLALPCAITLTYNTWLSANYFQNCTQIHVISYL